MRHVSFRTAAGVLAGIVVCSIFGTAAEPPAPKDRVFTAAGVPSDNSFFPIAVWLQDPRNAERYKAAGINLYVGLWKGPTAAQLTQLEKAGMPIICDQNAFALEQRANPIIAAWMHGDEPDNAQSLGQGKGYGPPITPEKIVADYQRLRAADATRPVLLNLGQGVAWDNYIGRGVRRNHPEDYPEYAKGSDMVSFDIYPAVHDSPEIAGRLEYVPRGVERLIGWTKGAKPVWNCIECTHIGNPSRKATPAEVRAEVWMALIRGSRGLIYFVHQFKPQFREAALLDDPEMLAAVTALNGQIRKLAPALNSPTLAKELGVRPEKAESTIAAMLKKQGETWWLFAANLKNEPARATFTVTAPGTVLPREAEVLDESRSVTVKDGSFADEFQPYAVHLYRLGPAAR
jgi:hypothetical protein